LTSIKGWLIVTVLHALVKAREIKFSNDEKKP